MALFSNKSNERRSSGDSSKDSPPLEPGESALSQEDVHSRADAVETAATRPLKNASGDSNEPLSARDNMQGTTEAADANVAAGSPHAEDKDRPNEEAHSKKRR